MAYTNAFFLFYFMPVLLTSYYLFNKSLKAQNLLLLAASALFYFWLNPGFILLLFLIIVCNYFLGLKIMKSVSSEISNRRLTLLGCMMNVGIFTVFQLIYHPFIKVGSLLSAESVFFKNIGLPVGLSLLTLRSISYIIDIYREKFPAAKNFFNFSLYLLFFPQLIAGPLTSFDDFQKQLLAKRSNKELFHSGLCRLVFGLGKKVLIANNLAVIVDKVFQLSAVSDSLTTVPMTLAALGLFCFVLQIYYDFSGYTDIAIGLCNMLGFQAPENFNYPYMALSMTDFWTRWNVTIKTWFDSYVLQPLDQKRAINNDQRILYMLVMFALFGFWHQISLGMLIWAIIQVFFIAFERVITFDQREVPRYLGHLYVVLVFSISWALLRSGSGYHIMLFYRNLLGMNRNGIVSPLAGQLFRENWPFLAAGLLFLFPLAPYLREKTASTTNALWQGISRTIYPLFKLSIFILVLIYLARGLYVPYPYFNF